MPSPGPSRFSTGDLVGPLLIFVGGFLLAAALALPTLYVDTLRTIPLSTDVTTVAPAKGTARILDPCSLDAPTARVVDAELTRQQRYVAVRPADADRVTLQAGTSIRAEHDATPCTDPTITAVRDRVTLNRATAEPDLISGAGDQPGSSEIQYDSNTAPVRVPDRHGFTYLLPFDVTESDHVYFDITTRRAVPLRYSGETTVHGRDAARFVADIPDTDLHQIGSGSPDGTPPTMITRPAAWFGVPGVDPSREVTATLHHSGHVELAVDIATGTILDEQITVEQTYRFTDLTLPDHRLTNLQATFAFDDQTRRRQSERATALATPVTVWGRVIPILAAIAGVGAIAGGLIVINPAWRPRRRATSPSGADPPLSS